jgi:hypothetical protein
VAIRRPVTLRYTARRGSDETGGVLDGGLCKAASSWPACGYARAPTSEISDDPGNHAKFDVACGRVEPQKLTARWQIPVRLFASFRINVYRCLSYAHFLWSFQK